MISKFSLQSGLLALALHSCLVGWSPSLLESVIHSLSSIFRHSNSPLRVCSQICLTWLLPLMQPTESHVSFEDATFAIFSKLDLSIALYKKYNANLSFTCVFFNAVIWTNMSWDSKRVFICKDQLS